MPLPGRDREHDALTSLLDRTRSGRGGALVLRGDPGAGKTALVSTVVADAEDMTVVWVQGFESEVRVGFAALHRLLLPFLDDLERLPEPQSLALGAAFGQVPTDEVPAPMLIGLAALTLLTEAALTSPVVCVVDDAHWLDAESLGIVTFVARRLLADRVSILFTVRSGDEYDEAFEGLPSIVLGPLDAAAARSLLSARSGIEVAPTVAKQLAAGTMGNPLALVELCGLLDEAQLTEAKPLPSPLPVGRRVGWKYVRDVQAFPAPTRTALLVAATGPSSSTAVVAAAAARLGGSIDDLGPAEDAGLVTVADRVTFRHPLTRAAVYGTATAKDRAAAHTALAEELDGVADEEVRLRHLAAAAMTADDDLAGALERCADRAGRSARLRDRTDLLVLSAGLTTDPDARGFRLLDAARSSAVVGSFRRGSALVGEAVEILTDPTAKAAARWVQGLFSHDHAHGTAPTQLLQAALELTDRLPELARGALVDTFTALTLAGAFGVVTKERVLSAAKSMPPPPDRIGVEETLLQSQLAWLEHGFAGAIPHLRRIAPAWIADPMEADQVARFGVLALLGSRELLEPRLPDTIVEHSLPELRRAGIYGSMQILLYVSVSQSIQAGQFSHAGALLAEAHDVNAMLGTRLTPALLDIELRAWRGLDDEVIEAARQLHAEADDTDHGFVAHTADVALVAHALGRGNADAALGPAQRLADDPFLGWTSRALPDLVEAAVRCGDRDVALDASQRMRARAEMLTSPLAAGLSARCGALVAGDTGAEDLYRASIDALSRGATPIDRARSELLYGEWLRRCRRPSDARPALRAAWATFEEVGAAAFALRARQELEATGERPRRRTSGGVHELTPRESQVARLAATGMTNPEIAATLFISGATVEYHLSKVYRKLGVSSRRQLRTARL